MYQVIGFILFVIFPLTLHAEGESENAVNLLTRELYNKSAYIPSQCYTKTIDVSGDIHNPCYSCHVKSQRPNYIDDSDLQLNYSFPGDALINPWANLFKDRTIEIDAITDDAISEYIRSSNYIAKDDEAGVSPSIALVKRLADLSEEWDYNGNKRWDGFTPDAWFNFDGEGFDRDPEYGYTGWRAFAYYPFLGTFWPNNGSTDDVLIRLPESFRTDDEGLFSLDIYKVNLAIVEAMLKEKNIPIDPVSEKDLDGMDIDKDGSIGIANQVTYEWAPLKKQFMTYVGMAKKLQKDGEIHLAAGLYPEGTEFLHSVRYIDVNDEGRNQLSARMKELRYAKKTKWLDYSQLRAQADQEVKEKDAFPDRLRTVLGDSEKGVSNGKGWLYAGYIEDAAGELRPQSYEELVFCVGCHGGIGGNRDGIFSFARKFDAALDKNDWLHWSQLSDQNIAEPLRVDGEHEYTHYLQHNGSGNEFRSNGEIQQRFFDQDGELKADQLDLLHEDMTHLLYASKERALLLNKAYRVIVREQSFVEGRDATLLPLETVHREVLQDEETGIDRLLKRF